MTTHRRCAIYVRVSTPDQHLSAQLREIRQAVAARGWTVVKVYKEKGSAKGGAERPVWEELRRDAARRKFGAVAVWSIDRMGRSTIAVLKAAEDFSTRGIRLLIVKEGIDSDTPLGKAFLTIGAMFAELERARISERTRVGLEGARRRGAQLGRRQIDVPRKLLVSLNAGKRTATSIAAELGSVSAQTVRKRAKELAATE